MLDKSKMATWRPKNTYPGFPGYELQFLYNQASFDRMNKGFSRSQAREKHGLR